MRRVVAVFGEQAMGFWKFRRGDTTVIDGSWLHATFAIYYM